MNFSSKIEKIDQSLKKVNADDIKKRISWFSKRLPDISHLKNIVLFSGIASLLVLILFAQRFAAIYRYIPTKPIDGGIYTEGVVGKIEQFNPLYTPLNSAEQAVAKLVFSGLVKKNANRSVDPDLAQSWEASADGKTYTFHLKENLKWSDGAELTSDDVVFTINTIQTPDVKSPLLEVWKGVEVTNSDRNTVVFKLQNSLPDFLNLANFAVLPKHLLESIPPRNLKTAEFSIKPVGSGPYIVAESKKIRESDEVVLLVNENFYDKKPYIPKIIIKTYTDYAGLIEGYIKKEVKGVERVAGVGEEEDKLPNIKLYRGAVPEYDALYFNLRTGVSKDKYFRQAVSYAVNRTQIIEEAYKGQASEIFAPVLPGYVGYNPEFKQNFDLASAKAKLTEGGYAPGPDGIMVKNEQKVSVRLVTSSSIEKSREADLIAVNLGLLGIETKIEKYPTNALIQDYIRPRNFDLLLISQNLGDSSDLYPFWHGTQANDPGLNFSGFSDRPVDKFIEQARVLTDKNQRAEKIRTITKIIWDETPAVFLVRPDYEYGVSNEVKGIDIGRLTDPSDRFWNITGWYIFEKRIDK